MVVRVLPVEDCARVLQHHSLDHLPYVLDAGSIQGAVADRNVVPAYHSRDADPTMGVASRNQLVPCQCINSAISAITAERHATVSPATRTLSFHRQLAGCHNLGRPTGWVNLF